MNIKKILVAVYALSTTIAFAQEQRIKEESKTIFKPHWFIQAQIGAAHTVGEGEFTDLISPAAALNVGYKFAPAFGARVGVSGWQAKGGWVISARKCRHHGGSQYFVLWLPSEACVQRLSFWWSRTEPWF